MTHSEAPPPDLETKSVPHGHNVVSYNESRDGIEPAQTAPPRGDQGGIVGVDRDTTDEEDDETGTDRSDS
jgi:hypothetical protein